jgi:hypothetical protein
MQRPPKDQRLQDEPNVINLTAPRPNPSNADAL